ncbi:hypothetical protein H2508_14250 [Parahaliea sp. F7430]|uniref:Type II secretion system protein GspC N-terminal domain-containing protein n=1 Tax=Sediminihaliea albiluteola TaxID=2758564 RepID=A0A7W2YLD1_9GAMM|nr:hypothetical protein [Sediminihaliea albiluteola]MBA6414273.1 hypothetical protein [Sediminihaliea albiluteola]
MTWFAPLRQRYRITSEPLRSERRVELLTLAFIAVLVVQVIVLMLKAFTTPSVEPILPAEDSLAVGALSGLQGISQEQSAELRARPMFWQSRRPYEAPPPEVKAPQEEKKAAAELKGVKLLGVFGSGDNAGVIALVKGKRQRVLQGGDLSGWTLREVSPKEVTLVNGARREILALERLPVTGTVLEVDARQEAETAEPEADTLRPQREPQTLSLGGQ